MEKKVVWFLYNFAVAVMATAAVVVILDHYHMINDTSKAGIVIASAALGVYRGTRFPGHHGVPIATVAAVLGASVVFLSA